MNDVPDFLPDDIGPSETEHTMTDAEVGIVAARGVGCAEHLIEVLTDKATAYGGDTNVAKDNYFLITVAAAIGHLQGLLLEWANDADLAKFHQIVLNVKEATRITIREQGDNTDADEASM